MTHIIATNDQQHSPLFEMEQVVPVTLVETPPMHAIAVRAYEKTPYGLYPLTEAWTGDYHETLSRSLSLPKQSKLDGTEKSLRELSDQDKIADIRMITHTVPSSISGIPKKKPDLMETRIGGGSIPERLDFALSLLRDGGVHNVGDIFSEGDYLDVAGITKGKGTQGPVKRWGVQKRKGKHYRQGYKRRIGNLGPWNPSRVRSTVPQQGQTGYHQRTEYNKRLLSIGDADEASVSGGFLGYGEVNGPHVLVHGSLPGPQKRLLRFRHATRPNRSNSPIEITHISKASNQG
jgi:large subunit ribosomal protein L3